MFKFSRASGSKLSTCHPDLIAIMKLALKRSQIDFGISDGYRSLEKQKEYYDSGASKIDGYTIKGKHNNMPSMAVDVYAFVGVASWDREYMAYLGGVVTSCAKELLECGEVSHEIRWGGNWDGDGVILKDQSFDDMPHFELK